MKIWKGFGSEHSSNLVMIGHFKTAQEAKAAKDKFDRIVSRLAEKIEFGRTENKFSDDEIQELIRENIYFFTPRDIEQLVFDYNCFLDDNKMCFTSEELEITVFVKYLVDNGAKVEVYSAHDYPDTGLGR